MKARRIFTYHYLKMKRYKGSPHAIAGGLAVGVFVGLTPTMPFHTLIITLICLVTRTSVIIAITVSWVVCNPLTYLPIYYFAALAGNRLTPYSLQMSKVESLIVHFKLEHSLTNIISKLLETGYETMIVMLAGGFAIALPCGIVTYYLCLPLFIKIHKKRAEKRALLQRD